MSGSARKVVMLSLYKKLLRESQNLNSFNYRSFALRKVKHEFRINREETDDAKLDALQKHAEESLEVLQRQVAIGNFYKGTPLVIENNLAAKKI